MPQFEAIVEKYAAKGEKTGWTYVEIPPEVLAALKLKNKREFRVKGKLDDVSVSRLPAYPVGDGRFILALNAELRKKLQKKEGARVLVNISLDKTPAPESADLLEALAEDRLALERFHSLTPSHRSYFHKHVESAKTPATRAARIVATLLAMQKGMNFGEMIRAQSALRKN